MIAISNIKIVLTKLNLGIAQDVNKQPGSRNVFRKEEKTKAKNNMITQTVHRKQTDFLDQH